MRAVMLCSLTLSVHGLPRLHSLSELGRCAEGDHACYAFRTASTLLEYYQDPTDGLFGDTLPWVEANAIETLCDYVIQMGGKTAPEVRPLWHNLTLMLTLGGKVTQPQYPSDRPDDCGEPYCGSFDDQAWWGLAWAKAYELTDDPLHLWRAVRTFVYLRDMSWDETQCSGGAWWSESRHYKNSITNQLFFSLAAQLHPLWNHHYASSSSSDGVGNTLLEMKRPWAGPNASSEVFDTDDFFLAWAKKSWSWIHSQPLRDPVTGLYWDGLNSTQCPNITIYSNGTGSDGNDRGANATWSYNQGVLLSGLGKLYEATRDQSLLAVADSVVQAVMDQMTVPSFDDEGNGGQILVEWACNTCYGCAGLSTPGSCQPEADGAMFKGSFMRHLGYFRRTPGLSFAHATRYHSFAQANAESTWWHSRQSVHAFGRSAGAPMTQQRFGNDFRGPYQASTVATNQIAALGLFTSLL